MSAALTRRAASAGLLSLGFGGAASATATPSPRRVVSLGACLDVILMKVADRGQIAAVSHYARDPQVSVMAAQAQSLRYTRETAEEVVALKPDLVIASQRTALQARIALKRLGYRVEEFEVPESVQASIDQVSRVAALVGHEDRGRALVARIELALAEAAAPPGSPKLPALIYQHAGLAAGKHTLISQMMERCGLENVAARYGLKKWGNVSLERLLTDPPQVLLLGEPPAGTPVSSDRIVMHPALASLEPRMHRINFPPRLLYCGGPVLIQTAGLLSNARRETQRLLAMS